MADAEDLSGVVEEIADRVRRRLQAARVGREDPCTAVPSTSALVPTQDADCAPECGGCPQIDSCATVMAVSGGYPGDYRKGFHISGLTNLDNEGGSMVFHAGTKEADDEVVTNGGRVLAVSSYGTTIGEAVAKSKELLENIHFEGMYYRRDIGYEFGA